MTTKQLVIYGALGFVAWKLWCARRGAGAMNNVLGFPTPNTGVFNSGPEQNGAYPVHQIYNGGGDPAGIYYDNEGAGGPGFSVNFSW